MTLCSVYNLVENVLRLSMSAILLSYVKADVTSERRAFMPMKSYVTLTQSKCSCRNSK